MLVGQSSERIICALCERTASRSISASDHFTCQHSLDHSTAINFNWSRQWFIRRLWVQELQKGGKKSSFQFQHFIHYIICNTAAPFTSNTLMSACLFNFICHVSLSTPKSALHIKCIIFIMIYKAVNSLTHIASPPPFLMTKHYPSNATICTLSTFKCCLQAVV